MKDIGNSLNVGLVLLSQDFRVVGINDHAQRLFGPMFKGMGKSLLLCHSRKSRERVLGVLKELTRIPFGIPRTMVIDVLGMVVMFNLSRLSIYSPSPRIYWSVSFIDVSEQTGATKNPRGGIVEMKKIPVYDGGAYQFLRTDEVLCIQSDGDYCKVFTPARSYYLHLSLKSILQRYPGTTFFQVHKSFIVNLCHVRKITYSEKGQSLIILDNASHLTVPVARRRAAALKRAMHHL